MAAAGQGGISGSKVLKIPRISRSFLSGTTRRSFGAAALCVFGSVGSAIPAFAQSVPATAVATVVDGIDLGAIDPAVRAQDDLYRHVNSHWLENTALPADKARIGTLDHLNDVAQSRLRGLIEQAQKEVSNDPGAQKIGDLYSSFMDTATIERHGLRPLAGLLGQIDAVTDRRQLDALLPRLAQFGVDVPIGLNIEQDDREATRYVPSLSQSGLGLPDRDYYLEGDAKFVAARASYVDYLATLLRLSGRPEEALPTARAVMALETDLARAQWTRVERRDPIKGYNRIALSALPEMAPGIDWPVWLRSAGIAGKTADVLVRQPNYLTACAALLDATPIGIWRAYARVHLLSAYAPYLPQAFVDARFAFAGTTLRGTLADEPRWKRGVQLVNRKIGEQLGQRYVAAYFPPEAKRRMDELVGNLLAAYRDSIGTLDWMGPATKQEALAKLAKFGTKIGYPKRWIDYGRLQIRADDLAGNVMRANDFNDAREVAKLGHPVDHDEWGMPPQTVNAYYDPTKNEVVFPAGILQAPVFSVEADDAVNYGAIGAVIGHEISHGFDDQGSRYDGDGNLREWWTAEDRERSAAKTRGLVAQYSAFVAVPPAYHVNGALTLGENIADISGLQIAWKAYQRALGGKPAAVVDGMTGDQRFFYGFAQVWRSKSRDAALIARIKSDPHSPERFRVIGTVRNASGFYSTFGIKPGDGMYLPPKDRVSIW